MTVKDLFMVMDNTFVAVKHNNDIVYSGMCDNARAKAWWAGYKVKNVKISNNEKTATVITIG